MTSTVFRSVTGMSLYGGVRVGSNVIGSSVSTPRPLTHLVPSMLTSQGARGLQGTSLTKVQVFKATETILFRV